MYTYKCNSVTTVPEKTDFQREGENGYFKNLLSDKTKVPSTNYLI